MVNYDISVESMFKSFSYVTQSNGRKKDLEGNDRHLFYRITPATDCGKPRKNYQDSQSPNLYSNTGPTKYKTALLTSGQRCSLLFGKVTGYKHIQRCYNTFCEGKIPLGKPRRRWEWLIASQEGLCSMELVSC
jgi:hypothetical protein